MADCREDSVEVKPSIIMKVDAPPEDNNTLTSQGSSMNNLDQNDSTKTPLKVKKPFLAAPRLNSNNPFTLRTNVLSSPKLNSSVVLRPSKLENKTENSKNPFALNPSRLNPFVKLENVDDSETTKTNDKTSETNNGTSSSTSPTTSSETPKFVPLGSSDANSTTAPSTTRPSSSTVTSNFVFGQNLHERVVSEAEASNDAATNSTSSEPTASTSNCTNANGTAELLFSSAVKRTTSTSDINKEVKSLSESAREYEESRANKRKYEEVQVVTGEEDEKNVLQINCKLFAYDKATGNWQERGRGTMRLNDREVCSDTADATYTQSRLVIRTTGNLRVVLNTKVWAEMTVERPSSKSLRLTAMDNSGQIKVFLIMANPDEINQLHRLLDARVQSEVERQKQLRNANCEPEVKKQVIDNSTTSEQ